MILGPKNYESSGFFNFTKDRKFPGNRWIPTGRGNSVASDIDRI
jgi:hypothetical protein